MQIFCKTLTGKTLCFQIDNDILVKDLKELIRVELSLSLEHQIILSRGDIGDLKDTDILVVSKKENVEERLPFFQTEGKQTHLSGAGFFIIVKAPKVSHANSDLYKPQEENIGKNNTQTPDNQITCVVS